jgi:hypothetical protein
MLCNQYVVLHSYTHVFKEIEYPYSYSLAVYRELATIAAKFLCTGRVIKCLCVCSLNDTTTVSILNLAVHVSLQWADMEVTRACLLGEDKVCLNFPQAASKLLPIRDIRRSYTRCMNSVTHITLRIFESCLRNFECLKTFISYGIS